MYEIIDNGERLRPNIVPEDFFCIVEFENGYTLTMGSKPKGKQFQKVEKIFFSKKELIGYLKENF
jgi:hypothetical protein